APAPAAEGGDQVAQPTEGADDGAKPEKGGESAEEGSEGEQQSQDETAPAGEDKEAQSSEQASEDAANSPGEEAAGKEEAPAPTPAAEGGEQVAQPPVGGEDGPADVKPGQEKAEEGKEGDTVKGDATPPEGDSQTEAASESTPEDGTGDETNQEQTPPSEAEGQAARPEGAEGKEQESEGAAGQETGEVKNEPSEPGETGATPLSKAGTEESEASSAEEGTSAEPSPGAEKEESVNEEANQEEPSPAATSGQEGGKESQPSSAEEGETAQAESSNEEETGESQSTPAAKESAPTPPEGVPPISEADGGRVQSIRKHDFEETSGEKPAAGERAAGLASTSEVEAAVCYVPKHQAVVRRAEEILGTSERNENFTKTDQAFCDELFKRIDGPYTVEDVSSMLRAADVANNVSRNFRFCRAAKNTSPPRIREGDSVLHAAIAASKPRVVEVLLQYGAFPNLEALPRDPTSRMHVGMKPLHYAAYYQTWDNLESLQLLFKYGAAVDGADVGGRTPLMIAARSLRPHAKHVVKVLLENKADIHARDAAGLQVLHHAAAANAAKVAKLLINHGAEVMSGDMRGNTPLHYAAAFNAADTIRVLSSLGGKAIDVNKQNINGKAPIHLAAAPSSYDAVRAEHVPAIALAALLEIHANPVARDAHGNTPLMDAVLGGYFEVVKRLLQIAHVPANDKNKDSMTALDLARKSNKSPALIEFLAAVAGNTTCPFIPRVEHATRTVSDTQLGSLLRIGDTVTYTCHHGYTMLGSETITCMARDGSTEFVPEPPICSPIKQGSAMSPIARKGWASWVSALVIGTLCLSLF
ncbi:rhoptry neck protein, partial [Cystoisospora suis]